MQDEEQDKREIRIRGNNPNSSEIAAYLLKTFLLLRDRENKEQYVKLLAIGTAIPYALLVSEIIRKKVPSVASITNLESFERKSQDQDGKDFSRYQTGLRITLTLDPTEEEKKSIGYQIPEKDKPKQHNQDFEQEDIKKVDLFDYVMLYVKDLYEVKMEKNKRIFPQRERGYGGRSQSNRRDDRKGRSDDRNDQRDRKDNRTSNREYANETYRGARRDNRREESNRGAQRNNNYNPDKEEHWENARERTQNDQARQPEQQEDSQQRDHQANRGERGNRGHTRGQYRGDNRGDNRNDNRNDNRGENRRDNLGEKVSDDNGVNRGDSNTRGDRETRGGGQQRNNNRNNYGNYAASGERRNIHTNRNRGRYGDDNNRNNNYRNNNDGYSRNREGRRTDQEERKPEQTRYSDRTQKPQFDQDLKRQFEEGEANNYHEGEKRTRGQRRP